MFISFLIIIRVSFSIIIIASYLLNFILLLFQFILILYYFN